eukprot:scaffold4535_cov179-Amphora_coffeaeformis.AAC.2
MRAEIPLKVAKRGPIVGGKFGEVLERKMIVTHPEKQCALRQFLFHAFVNKETLGTDRARGTKSYKGGCLGVNF